MLHSTSFKVQMCALLGLLVTLALLGTSSAQLITERPQAAPVHHASAPATLIIPSSNMQQKPPRGHNYMAHTNVSILRPAGLQPDEAPPYSGYGYETPASIACHYGLVTTSQSPNCNPNLTTVNPTGGSKTIAIVDAYDDPAAPGDLAWYSVFFGLPFTAQQFEVVPAMTANSSCFYYGYVPTDESGGWEAEESLDIEMAHAMAPSAKIYLVEACSPDDTDLQQAVLVANNLVRCGLTEINPTTGALGTCPSNSTGKGEVSMSFGGDEFTGENGSTGCAPPNGVTFNDSCFTQTGVVYFASSGDGPGVIWPGSSANVVSAGGTSIRRNDVTFNFIQEVPWADAGGGESAIETRPSYQSSISSIVGNTRGVPDLSFDADPDTGVWVYDTFPLDGFEYYEWAVFGGTSVSSPALAGIINRAGAFAASSNAELTTMYANKANTADFTDIVAGYCGFYRGFTAGTGWDFCTGIGIDKAYTGK